MFEVRLTEEDARFVRKGLSDGFMPDELRAFMTRLEEKMPPTLEDGIYTFHHPGTMMVSLFFVVDGKMGTRMMDDKLVTPYVPDYDSLHNWTRVGDLP